MFLLIVVIVVNDLSFVLLMTASLGLSSSFVDVVNDFFGVASVTPVFLILYCDYNIVMIDWIVLLLGLLPCIDVVDNRCFKWC